MGPAAGYAAASTINWNRNVITRLAHGLLRPMYGESLFRFSRPLALEEPKLFAAVLCLIPGCMSLLALGCVERARRRNVRNIAAADHDRRGRIAGERESTDSSAAPIRRPRAISAPTESPQFVPRRPTEPQRGARPPRGQSFLDPSTYVHHNIFFMSADSLAAYMSASPPPYFVW